MLCNSPGVWLRFGLLLQIRSKHNTHLGVKHPEKATAFDIQALKQKPKAKGKNINSNKLLSALIGNISTFRFSVLGGSN